MDNNIQIGVSDYLKSNCRSWEMDCDNEEDTNTLAHHLVGVFEDLSVEKAFEIAKDWTGYEEFDKTKNLLADFAIAIYKHSVEQGYKPMPIEAQIPFIRKFLKKQ